MSTEVRSVSMAEVRELLASGEWECKPEQLPSILESLCVRALVSVDQAPLKDMLSAIRAVTAALEVTRGKETRVQHHHENRPDDPGEVS